MSDSDPLGTAFSRPREVHAFSHGVYKGLTTRPWRTPPAPDREDVKAESAYYRGGYVVGTLLQVVAIVALSSVGIGWGGLA